MHPLGTSRIHGGIIPKGVPVLQTAFENECDRREATVWMRTYAHIPLLLMTRHDILPMVDEEERIHLIQSIDGKGLVQDISAHVHFEGGNGSGDLTLFHGIKACYIVSKS